MSKPRKAAIYARVSTTDQDPDAQLLALREDIYRIVAIIQPRHSFAHRCPDRGT
jgi:DNA invertase Pin-like site-specific DNA recombinase